MASATAMAAMLKRVNGIPLRSGLMNSKPDERIQPKKLPCGGRCKRSGLPGGQQFAPYLILLLIQPDFISPVGRLPA
jgi:hypothetical protein